MWVCGYWILKVCDFVNRFPSSLSSPSSHFLLRSIQYPQKMIQVSRIYKTMRECTKFGLGSSLDGFQLSRSTMVCLFRARLMANNRILFRDLKPDNLVIDGNNVKLIDYGGFRKFDEECVQLTADNSFGTLIWR